MRRLDSFIALLLGFPFCLAADELPAMPADGFGALLGQSPFTRSLDLNRDLALTGVGEIDGRPVITIFDIEKKITHVVSDKDEGESGFRVLEVVRGEGQDLGYARLLVNGVEMRIRYDAETSAGLDQVRVAVKRSKVPTKPPKDWARPPKHIEQMYHKMSKEQRGRYHEWAADYYKDNPEKRWSADRFPVVERALKGVLSGSRELPSPGR